MLVMIPVDEMGASTKVPTLLDPCTEAILVLWDSTVSMLEKTLSPGSPQNLFQSKTPGMAAIVRPGTL
jgi:hypothetical protein